MSIETYHLLDFPTTGNLAGISLRMSPKEVEQCWGSPEEKERIELQDNPTYSYRENWRYSNSCINLEFIENYGLSQITLFLDKAGKESKVLISKELNLDLDLPSYVFSPFHLREFLDERKIRYTCKVWGKNGLFCGDVAFFTDNHMALCCDNTLYDGYEISVYIWNPGNEYELEPEFGNGHPPTEEGYSDNYY
jgi:hypothetical protein